MNFIALEAKNLSISLRPSVYILKSLSFSLRDSLAFFLSFPWPFNFNDAQCLVLLPLFFRAVRHVIPLSISLSFSEVSL